MATILVVEDHAVTQRTILYMLRKDNHQTVTASNGKEALAQLETHTVDLVLCDIAMPEMDGLDFLRHMRAQERFKNLPVIMLTASGQDEDRINARALGANDMLAKPTSTRELSEAIHRWLGRK
jgi:two-component system, chemotaxis family, chemotaxis protein CheY